MTVLNVLAQLLLSARSKADECKTNLAAKPRRNTNSKHGWSNDWLHYLKVLRIDCIGECTTSSGDICYFISAVLFDS